MSRTEDEWKNLQIENVPENIKKCIVALLEGLSNRKNYRLKLDIDKQCYDRFGLSWKQVQEEMHRRVSKGFRLLHDKEDYGAFRLTPEHILHFFANRTGNWMTNNFIWVLRLKFAEPSAWQRNAYVKELEKPETLNTFSDEGIDDHETEKVWFLLGLAPYVFPEKVRGVLGSYDIDL